MALDFQQYFDTTEKDILYGILEACGGDMSDIVQYFHNGTNDLLYAILVMIKANGGVGGSAGNATILPAGTTQFNIPAGKLLKDIWFQGGSAANIGVGLSNATTEIFDPGQLAEGGDLLFDGAKPFRQETTIYFNGVNPDTVTIIYLL